MALHTRMDVNPHCLLSDNHKRLRVLFRLARISSMFATYKSKINYGNQGSLLIHTLPIAFIILYKSEKGGIKNETKPNNNNDNTNNKGKAWSHS